MDGAARLAGHVRNHHAGNITAFARVAGIPRPQVSLYLSRTRTPGLSNALSIERASKGAVPIESWDRPASKRPSRRSKPSPHHRRPLPAARRRARRTRSSN